MMKWTDDEFKDLQKRVRVGKKVLEGKWHHKDRETREWVELWFTLSDALFEEMKRRKLFGAPRGEHLVSKGALPGETSNDYIDRMKAKMIIQKKFVGRWANPWLKAYIKKKGGVENIYDQSESKRSALFTS